MRILDVDRTQAAQLIHAAVILHNFLGPPLDYNATGDINQHRRANLQQRTPAATQRARDYRDRFVQYFAGLNVVNNEE